MASLADYKFWYIKRDDDGVILEAAVRFYEGEVTTQSELVRGVPTDITRYRRTAKLDPKTEDHLKDKPTRKDQNNLDVTLYTQADFGQITDKNQLTDFLDKELEKDKVRAPIDEQKVKIR